MTPPTTGYTRSSLPTRRPVLITGGAGFVGTNLADRLLSEGTAVSIFDNLSRRGVSQNLAWLRERHGNLLRFEPGDMRDADAVAAVAREATQVFHLAAQVAVTNSLENPVEDFEVNARGTLNLLEALRQRDEPVPLLFTSTNKVYGHFADLELRERPSRYEPLAAAAARHGFNEERPVDFHSPYGCSKGAADQYVLDYARTFGIPTVVFRMSCIYGPHQLGNEDQGWVAHFLLQTLTGQPITLYGDGKQVRDILHVSDLVDAFLLVRERFRELSGHAFNIGGGTENSVSLLELLQLIEEVRGHPPFVEFDEWRRADQRYYVSDTRAFRAATGWQPEIDVRTGVMQLHEWLAEHRCAKADESTSTGTGPNGKLADVVPFFASSTR